MDEVLADPPVDGFDPVDVFDVVDDPDCLAAVALAFFGVADFFVPVDLDLGAGLSALAFCLAADLLTGLLLAAFLAVDLLVDLLADGLDPVAFDALLLAVVDFDDDDPLADRDEVLAWRLLAPDFFVAIAHSCPQTLRTPDYSASVPNVDTEPPHFLNC